MWLMSVPSLERNTISLMLRTFSSRLYDNYTNYITREQQKNVQAANLSLYADILQHYTMDKRMVDCKEFEWEVYEAREPPSAFSMRKVRYCVRRPHIPFHFFSKSACGPTGYPARDAPCFSDKCKGCFISKPLSLFEFHAKFRPVFSDWCPGHVLDTILAQPDIRRGPTGYPARDALDLEIFFNF
jgi:hypothetical protein